MTIGISAMMALQTPITAFAEEPTVPGGTEPTSEGETTPTNTEETEFVYEAPAEVATSEAQAETALDNIQGFADELPAPENPIPEENSQPEGTQPEGTQPEGTQPEGAQPEGTQPEGTQPEGTQPEGSTESTENAEEGRTEEEVRAFVDAAKEKETNKDKNIVARADDIANKVIDAVPDDIKVFENTENADIQAAVTYKRVVKSNGDRGDMVVSTDADAKNIVEMLQEAKNQAELVENGATDETTGAINGGLAKETFDAAKSAFEQYEETKETADAVDAMVGNKEDRINELIAICNGEGTYEEKAAAFAELEEIQTYLNGCIENLNGKLEDGVTTQFKSAVSQFNTAYGGLSKAESDRSIAENAAINSIGKAQDAAEDARKKVDAVTKRVDEFQESIAQVKAVLNTDARFKAVYDKAEKENVLKGDKELSSQGNTDEWNFSIVKDYLARRKIALDVATAYYIPQVVEAGNTVSNISVTKEVKNLDKQEFDYFEVTYTVTDANGKKETKKKYFNWDGIEKQFDEDNPYINVNSDCDSGIVVFEKDLDEIEANNALATGYKYTDDEGKVHYITREEYDTLTDTQKESCEGAKQWAAKASDVQAAYKAKLLKIFKCEKKDTDGKVIETKYVSLYSKAVYDSDCCCRWIGYRVCGHQRYKLG